MKISFELHKFFAFFQEFQNIFGQNLVDAVKDFYDGYFQELLGAIGKLYFVWWTAHLSFHSQYWPVLAGFNAWVGFNWSIFLGEIIWKVYKLQESSWASGLMQWTGNMETLMN